MSNTPLIPCPDCGALVADLPNGATHAYIGASAGCWALFNEVGVREMSPGYSTHNLTVDTYMAQHPGKPERRTIQSVAVHLISLYWVLEKQHPPYQAVQKIRQALGHKEHFIWLAPPKPFKTLTIAEIHAAAHAAEHVRLVNQWAREVWAAWSEHHTTIQTWAQLSHKE